MASLQISSKQANITIQPSNPIGTRVLVSREARQSLDFGPNSPGTAMMLHCSRQSGDPETGDVFAKQNGTHHSVEGSHKS